MYSLQQSSELENQIPYILPSSSADQNILNHLPIATAATFLDTPNNYNTNNNISSIAGNEQKLQRRSSMTEVRRESKRDDQGHTNHHHHHNNMLKRLMHRDIERQRRQGMASLYASLRSLLPLEYIKGKRAVSDLMHEAVNYIKYLQKNISQLRARRVSLLHKASKYSGSSGNLGTANPTSSSSSSFHRCTNVEVSLCRDGVEVLIRTISSSPEERVFPLSTVLKMLLAQGFNVVSCVSTTANHDIKVHKILSEVTEDHQTCIDVLALQQKLANLINPGLKSE